VLGHGYPQHVPERRAQPQPLGVKQGWPQGLCLYREPGGVPVSGGVQGLEIFPFTVILEGEGDVLWDALFYLAVHKSIVEFGSRREGRRDGARRRWRAAAPDVSGC